MLGVVVVHDLRVVPLITLHENHFTDTPQQETLREFYVNLNVLQQNI